MDILADKNLWEVLPFDEVIEDRTGGNTKILTNRYNETGVLPIVDQGKDLISGFIDDPTVAYKGCLPVIIFGDHTRIVKFVDFPFALGADGVKVLGFKKKVFPKFIYYLFKTLNIPDTGYNRHFKYLKRSQIPLPPLETQIKIANALDKADSIRQKDKQIIQKYDELLQSVFLEMFGDPVRNEKGWDVSLFKNKFSSIRYGTSTPPKYSDSGIPFIRATNVKGGTIVKKGMVYICEEEAKSIEKCRVKQGDIIIVRSGINSGDCAKVTHEYNNTLAGYDLIIEIAEPYSTFYNFYLNSPSGKNILKPLSRRAGQPHLNSDQIKSLVLISPPDALIERFSSISAKIEQQKSIAQQSLQKSEELFNSILQRAFKGELFQEPVYA